MTLKAIDKSVIRISAEDARAAALWTLPVVQSDHVVALEQKPVNRVEDEVADDSVAAKLTLAELEKIREDAYQEGLQQGKADGLQQGLDEGREAGRAEGLENARAETERQQLLLKNMRQELEQPLLQVNSAVDQLVVDMVLELSRALVGEELSQRSGVVTAAVEEAVAQLPQGGGEIKVLLHPDDRLEIEPLLELNERWQLVDDASVARGGCKVLSGYGLIDNSVERRFEAAASQLRNAMAEVAVEGEVDADLSAPESH